MARPFWVKFHRGNGYQLRRVSADFAIGRVALLAQWHENYVISNDLLAWAKKVHQYSCTIFNAPDPSMDTALAARQAKKRWKKEALRGDDCPNGIHICTLTTSYAHNPLP
ncbi:hypothetical protein B0H13DRAFT_1884171 [Mycena leptocephala]|nr:hypothetical protein B0H13DRAFT_1884171 [Mycena leptocephala]